MRDNREGETRIQVECDTDVLVDLSALPSEADLGSDLNQDARFLEWRSRELRAAPGGATEEEVARMSSMQRNITVRVVARRAGIRMSSGEVAQVNTPVQSLETAIHEAGLAGYAPRVELAVAAGSGRELWDEPCDTWVKLPDSLPRNRYVVFDVRGASMEPLLHSGDIILVRLDRVPRRDTVVVAWTGEGYVVKLAGRISENSLELRSLNAAFADVRVPYHAHAVVGTVVASWCRHDAAGGGTLISQVGT